MESSADGAMQCVGTIGGTYIVDLSRPIKWRNRAFEDWFFFYPATLEAVCKLEVLPVNGDGKNTARFTVSCTITANSETNLLGCQKHWVNSGYEDTLYTLWNALRQGKQSVPDRHQLLYCGKPEERLAYHIRMELVPLDA